MQPGTSLVEILDQTTTPMGGRLLRNWLVTPLSDLAAIQQRHDAVQWLVDENQARQKLTDLLPGIGDLARLTARMAMLKSGPRELVQLGLTLERVPEIIQILHEAHLSQKINALFEGLNPCPEALHLLKSTLNDDAPAVVGKGHVINTGIHEELDQLRHISRSGKEYLAGIQQREAAETGIPSLKVAYNNVFGYYIEVTNAHKNEVPDTWHRKQTLTNAERYITPELKTLRGTNTGC
jgi:DNA mismatch repair protein MutS